MNFRFVSFFRRLHARRERNYTSLSTVFQHCDHALSSSRVCLSAGALTYTANHVFSCRVRIIVRYRKRDKRKSSRDTVTGSVPVTVKKEDGRVYPPRDPSAPVWENAVKEICLHRRNGESRESVYIGGDVRLLKSCVRGTSIILSLLLMNQFEKCLR